VPLRLKAQKPKDYSDAPQTLGEHLKKRRRELGFLQREAAERMGILTETYANWEKDKTKPVSPQYKPVVRFLGYDPSPPPTSLAERVEAKRRNLGATLDQLAQYLRWDEGSLRRYLRGEWRLSPMRAAALERFLNLDQKQLARVVGHARRKR